MIKILELRELINLFHQSSLDQLELHNGGVNISLKKEAPVVSMPTTGEVSAPLAETAVPAVASEPAGHAAEPPLHPIVSPVIGIFASAPEAGAAPFVKVGDTVTPGTVLCNCDVEPLDLFCNVKSDVNGKIVQILARDGDLVEYGQTLFLVQLEKGEKANV